MLFFQDTCFFEICRRQRRARACARPLGPGPHMGPYGPTLVLGGGGGMPHTGAGVGAWHILSPGWGHATYLRRGGGMSYHQFWGMGGGYRKTSFWIIYGGLPYLNGQPHIF